MSNPFKKRLSARIDKFLTEKTNSEEDKAIIRELLGLILGNSEGQIPLLGSGGKFSEDRLPLTIGALTVSATAPPSPREGQGWLDMNSGRTFAWVVTNSLTGAGCWIEQFGGSSYPAPAIINTSQTSYTLGNAAENAYVRLTANSSKAVYIPLVSGGFAPAIGSVFSVRNVGTGNATWTSSFPGVTIIKLAGAELIPTGSTGQVMYLGDNTWEIQ